jgi:hypothetical protein
MAKKIDSVKYAKGRYDPPKITRYKNPTTGKPMSDFEGAIGSAPSMNSSLDKLEGTKVGRQGKGLVGNEDGAA